MHQCMHAFVRVRMCAISLHAFIAHRSIWSHAQVPPSLALLRSMAVCEGVCIHAHTHQDTHTHTQIHTFI